MENITLGQISAVITFVVAFISGLSILYSKIKIVIKETLKEELEDLKKGLKEESLSRCKNDLVVIMSKIANGYIPTKEEIIVLYETKNKYNQLGGDSYVDDMFEKLKKENKL